MNPFDEIASRKRLRLKEKKAQPAKSSS